MPDHDVATLHSPINFASYPHIVEGVLAFSDYPTMLAFRRTCRSLRDRADSLLCGNSISIPEGVSDCKQLPYFHPDFAESTHNKAMQHRAINAARLILLDGMDASPETNQTLSHIHPESRVVLNHEPNSVVRLRLPEVADLTILGSHQCCCNDVWASGEGGNDGNGDGDGAIDSMDLDDEEDDRYAHRFSHGAHAVHIDVSLNPDPGVSHYRCALVKAALTPRVHSLTISVGEVFHLGMVLAVLQHSLSQQDRHPSLRLQVRFKGGPPEFDIQALLAGLLEIDHDRITIDEF